MDLVFDNDRLYLHNATAHYGAIPLCVSGGARGVGWCWVRRQS